MTDDRFDIDTHSTSKFLFYHFNNLRHDLGEEAYKVTHTIVLDNTHVLESLQSKDWSYFINRLLEVFNGDISSLNLNDIGELKIINDAVENLKIFKNCYADIYANASRCFQNYLRSAPDVILEKMQDDLKFNLYSNIDFKNELNTRETLQTFDRFFFCIWKINKLIIVPTGNVPSFVKSSGIISPSELYKRFKSGETRELVCIHFLAALTVHLGGEKMISKNTLSEFFHNLSMQGLSKSDDTIVIKFDAINRV